MAQNTPLLSRFDVLPARLDNGAGLVGWWPLADGSAQDFSGFGHPGALTNVSAQPNVFGPGPGMIFGSTSSIVISNSTSFFTTTATGELSVSAWVLATSTAGQRTVVAKGFNGSTTEWFLVSETGVSTFLFGTFSGVNHGVRSVGTVPTNRWAHIAGTLTGATWRVYINGLLDNTNVDSIGAQTNARFVEVGSVDNNGTPAQSWVGSLRDVRVYNRRLLDDEVNAIYNAGWQVIDDPLQAMFIASGAFNAAWAGRQQIIGAGVV